MSYQFIEHKYPMNDPNPLIDVNFESDLLYNSISSNQKLPNIPDIVVPTVVPMQRTKKHKIKNTASDYSPYTNIYVLFIIFTIIIILLWYFFGGQQKNKQIEVIDTYADNPKLIMLSPDIGMGMRYGLV
jgi:hypothetical protein